MDNQYWGPTRSEASNRTSHLAYEPPRASAAPRRPRPRPPGPGRRRRGARPRVRRRVPRRDGAAAAGAGARGGGGEGAGERPDLRGGGRGDHAGGAAAHGVGGCLFPAHGTSALRQAQDRPHYERDVSPTTRRGESHRSIPLPAKARLKPGLRPRDGTGAISGTYPLTNENGRSIIRITMVVGTSVRLLRLRPYQWLPGRAIVESALGRRGLTFTVVMARPAGQNQLSPPGGLFP